MHLKLELLKGAIVDAVMTELDLANLDVDEIANTMAIRILLEIKDIIHDKEKEDFDVVEEIVCVFEKYGIDIGGRHDF